jgi:hypothetical protein
MALQTPVIIQIQERWSSSGFTILISDKRTAYSVGFHDGGDLLIHACKIVEGNIQFDHNQVRGVAINLNQSTYESWGLNPKSMSTIYSLFNKLNQDESEIIKLRERIAELEHKQWSHWTKYILENIDLENITRWKLQTETPYDQLSEDEKDNDRVWADKVLEVLLKSSVAKVE